MSDTFTDLVARYVLGRGWLPILVIQQGDRRRELYRGEYQPTLVEATTRAAQALERIKAERREVLQ